MNSLIKTLLGKTIPSKSLTNLMKFLKKFVNHQEYSNYIPIQNKRLPNVSLCKEENEVHYNQKEPRIVAIFTTTTPNQSVQIIGNSGMLHCFTAMEIDGKVYTGSSFPTSFYFETPGNHTIKYTLADPTIINNQSFQNSDIESINIPDSVITIGDRAFEGCSNLTSIIIPDSVIDIGIAAFSSCTNLESVTVKGSQTNIKDSSFSNCTNLDTINIPYDLNRIGILAFNNTAWYNEQSDGLVYLNNVLYKYKGTMPDNTQLTLSNSTIGIAGQAFYNCTGLQSITLSDSLVTIESEAFSGCTNLSSIIIPKSVVRIEPNIFKDCDLESITVNNQNKIFDSRNNCNAIIDTSNNKLVAGCKNTVIPDGIVNIGSFAFNTCSGLEHIDVPDTITIIENYAFSKTNLTSISFNNVTIIGEQAFFQCENLASVNIGNYVERINLGAFRFCTSLTSITLPNTLTRIEQMGFYGCSNLENITSLAMTAPTLGTSALGNVKSNGILKVPQDSTGYNTWMTSSNLGRYNWSLETLEQ